MLAQVRRLSIDSHARYNGERQDLARMHVGFSLLVLALACETSCVLGFIHLRMDTAAQSETLVSLVRAYSASCTSLTTGKGIRVSPAMSHGPSA